MGVENNSLENLNDQNNQLSELKDILGKNKGFEDFQKLFSSLDQTQRDKFLTVIKNNPNAKNYYDYKRGKKLPNIDEKNKFDEFIEKYGKDVIINTNFENKERKKEKGNEIDGKQQKIETRNNIVNDLKIHPLYKEYFADNKINEILKNPEYQEWIKKNNDKDVILYIIEKNYDKFLDIAIKQDLKNKVSPTDKNSNSYKLFSNLQALEDSGLNIQAELVFKLKLAEHSPDNTISSTKTNLARLSIDTTEYHRTEIHGNIVLYGDQVINLETNEKFIKSKLGYLLKSSELEFNEGREYQERIDKKNDEIEGIDNEIKSNKEKISELNQVSLGITTLDLTNKKLLDDYLYKRYLKTNNTPPELVEPYNKLRGKIENVSDNIGNIDLQEDLRNSLQEVNTLELNIVKKKNSELFKQKDDLNESLIKLKEDYEKSEKQFKSKLETKDKMQRESIKFINRIALDVIPQNLLNRLIDMLKSNMIIIPGLDIDRQAINLENQQFGNSVTVENDTLWERNLIKFLNKLVYGEINPKDTIFKEDEIIKNPKYTIRPSTMRFTLESKDLMGSDGFHINKMIQNLRKVEKSK